MAATELRAVLGSRPFRKLFAVRLTGQFCDGLFQAALATFVLFSPERQANAVAIAVAFTVLYLPYSLVGPFAGVFLDKWSRRQVLLFGNVLRAAIVVGVCFITAAGNAGLLLSISVLVALGVNRFILAGLSAALPHTVERAALVTGNALAPTAGTIAAAIGGVVGVGIRAAAGGSDHGSVVVLAVVVVGYVLSGVLALRISRSALGPDGREPGENVRAVIAGLVDGARVLWNAKPAFRSVSASTIQRTVLGCSTTVLILLLRNTLNDSSQPDRALAGLTLCVGFAAIGAIFGAALTPVVTRRIGTPIWSTAALVFTAVLGPIGLGIPQMWALATASFATGLGGQALKVCADTRVQRHISDNHLGRVFSLFDMSLNVGLVIGVCFAAFAAPASGQSIFVLVVMVAVLLAAAAWMFTTRAQEEKTPTSP